MGKETGADTDIFKIPPVVWNFPQSRTLLGLAFVIANFRKHTDTHTHAHPSKWQRRRPVKYAINCRFHSWKFTGPTKKVYASKEKRRKLRESWGNCRRTLPAIFSSIDFRSFLGNQESEKWGNAPWLWTKISFPHVALGSKCTGPYPRVCIYFCCIFYFSSPVDRQNR